MPRIPIPTIVIFTATVTVFAVMGLVVQPHLASLGGGPIFDFRFFGFGHAEAVRYLEALGPAGRNEYLEIWQKIDIAFPALYFLSFAWIAATAYAAAGLRGWTAWVAAVCTVGPAAAFDYAENVAVAAMLRAQPQDVTPTMVSVASGNVLIKWALVAVASVLVSIGLALAFARRAR